MRPLLLTLLFVGLFLPLIRTTIVDDLAGVVDDFWRKANPIGSITVDSIELSDFMKRYNEDSNSGDSLQISESHFINGAQNWTNEFANRGLTTQFSKAYYRSFDVFNVGAPYTRFITFEDMDRIIDLIHFYIYGNTDNSGFLSESEFQVGFANLIFRNVPFGLLFINFAEEPSLPGLDQMHPDVFESIFDAIDSNNDDKLTASELGVFWEQGLYGPSETGINLFTRLDLDSDSLVTRDDWAALFLSLDCRPGQRHIDILDLREFYQLDLILNDVIPHPASSGNCTLTSVPGFNRLHYDQLTDSKTHV